PPALKMRTSGAALGSAQFVAPAGISPRNTSPDIARLPSLTLEISTNWVAEPRRSLVPSATTARICHATGDGSGIWKERRSPCSIPYLYSAGRMAILLAVIIGAVERPSYVYATVLSCSEP